MFYCNEGQWSGNVLLEMIELVGLMVLGGVGGIGYMDWVNEEWYRYRLGQQSKWSYRCFIGGRYRINGVSRASGIDEIDGVSGEWYRLVDQVKGVNGVINVLLEVRR